MMKKCVAGLLILSFAGLANAAPIVQEITIPTSTTSFSTDVMFEKFDDMGGSLTLQSVVVSFDGLIEGSVGIESLDAMANTVTTTVSTSLTLDSAMMGTLLDMSPPDIVNAFDVSAFDGSIDFGGTSGTSFEVGDSVASSATFTDASILDYFTGDDMVTIIFNAMAASFASGPGNLASQFNMAAGGTITVQYDSISTQVVSAPATLGLIAFAGIAAFGFRRTIK